MVKNYYIPGMRSSLLFWNSISLETFVLIVGSNGTLKASWASCLVGTQYKLLCSALFHWLCLTFDDWCTGWMLSNVEGKNAWKKQKNSNKIGSETSMKKHWKNVCVNYLQNVKFRVKKRFLRLAAVHVLQQRLWKWWWKLPALPSFHALIKRRRTWFHYVTWIRDCKIVWQTFFVLIWLRWLHFWGGRCKIILLYNSALIKKEKIIWIWRLFSDLHWMLQFCQKRKKK